MDQIKIGKFIARRRKAADLTQAQLAEKLGITDRAVSKWETGKTLPDSSIMLELCGILGITVNELLSGEEISMENYNQEMENKLLELVKAKETADKRLLRLEVFIGFTAVIVLFACVFFAAFAEISTGLRIGLMVFGFLVFLAICFYALRIEQVAGYYRCAKCGHKYVPSYKAVAMAPHLARTRHMRCPACNQKSWQKKVVSED